MYTGLILPQPCYHCSLKVNVVTNFGFLSLGLPRLWSSSSPLPTESYLSEFYEESSGTVISIPVFIFSFPMIQDPASWSATSFFYCVSIHYWQRFTLRHLNANVSPVFDKDQRLSIAFTKNSHILWVGNLTIKYLGSPPIVLWSCRILRSSQLALHSALPACYRAHHSLCQPCLARSGATHSNFLASTKHLFL